MKSAAEQNNSSPDTESDQAQHQVHHQLQHDASPQQVARHRRKYQPNDNLTSTSNASNVTCNADTDGFGDSPVLARSQVLRQDQEGFNGIPNNNNHNQKLSIKA